ncbi:MAG TPA: hypothetical protein VN839_10805 [Patescibacteria group bacterium]|jgi:hypothetical protein|nr:hypothetical protein [Patescibacteria group bacterium]
MDTAGLIVLPRAEDPIDADLREVDVAIALVAQGAAVRVRLVGLASADRIAPFALAHAQSAGVDFRVDGSGPTTRLIFGPS